jgi:hypothetical protein
MTADGSPDFYEAWGTIGARVGPRPGGFRRSGPLPGTHVAQAAGSDDYVFSGRQLDIGLRRVAVTGLAAPLVIDPDAAGVLYSSPIRFQSFEEAAGRTNTSLVRIESNGLFVVQRVGAIAAVPVTS